GDPPLFVGFLKGVDFFWTLNHLWFETLTVAAIVLTVFFLFDLYLHHRDECRHHPLDPTPDSPLKLHGPVNLLLIGVIIAAILMSAYWKPGIAFHIFGVEIELQNILRDVIFVAVTLVSIAITRQECRSGNDFSWGPITEVAKLFAAIFTCIVPVI